MYYVFFSQHDHQGSDIGDCEPLGDLTVEQVADTCTLHPECYAFNIFKPPALAGLPMFCLKSDSTPLVDRSDNIMFGEECSGIYLVSELS